MDTKQDIKRTITPLPGKEKTILMVEPNPKAAEKMYLLFRREGFAAIMVQRVSEAIRNIQQEHVSVLILDVDAKDMAWDEAVPIIKGLNSSLPIIITAASNSPELEAHILHQKIFYYHVKSFGTEELLLAVRNAVEKSREK